MRGGYAPLAGKNGLPACIVGDRECALAMHAGYARSPVVLTHGFVHLLFYHGGTPRLFPRSHRLLHATPRKGEHIQNLKYFRHRSGSRYSPLDTSRAEEITGCDVRSAKFFI